MCVGNTIENNICENRPEEPENGEKEPPDIPSYSLLMIITITSMLSLILIKKVNRLIKK